MQRKLVVGDLGSQGGHTEVSMATYPWQPVSSNFKSGHCFNQQTNKKQKPVLEM